jgi:hypothetical protein
MPDAAQVHRGLHLVTPLVEGDDVHALQLASNDINKAKGGFWHVEADSEYGDHTAHAAYRSAWAIGIGDQDLAELHGHGHCTQEVQLWLRHPETRNDVQKERAEKIKDEVAKRIADHHNFRSGILENAKWGVTNTAQIHYQQSRPIDGTGNRDKLPLNTDCSGFATLCYEWAGAPDPNGSGFNGFGFTGTILGHCRHVPKSDANAGDLVVFGVYPGTHVVILIEDGTHADPLCVSHGQEAGPIEVRLSVESGAHAGQIETFCTPLS